MDSWSSSVSTWDEGDGRFDDNPESTQGCSWKYVDGDLAVNKINGLVVRV